MREVVKLLCYRVAQSAKQNTWEIAIPIRNTLISCKPKRLNNRQSMTELFPCFHFFLLKYFAYHAERFRQQGDL